MKCLCQILGLTSKETIGNLSTRHFMNAAPGLKQPVAFVEFLKLQLHHITSGNIISLTAMSGGFESVYCPDVLEFVLWYVMPSTQ